mmetsp:Transcript_19246/g.53484  ORF Transcript_19246/g.53484 Transcript_19246/m.53484 type:complete len:291 (-) Transcript_19246:218-1090(-)|eukprot:CAMPEP_0198133340 /NCGR_PEP_ID=MMETSP1442-20131203/59513_1 /TAXON_ID= /ORGANISM="Craspedostauros australis, Strain CCMP3328" /LENGTH=290 /DNA_ID=CAMNT_0043794457 /DNA_START=424 /DNA_END=1296 /DNA_ORIENTATION=-
MAERRFTTILAARKNDKRPSDVEFELRGHCKRVKVVSQLFGDAHLVFPSESSLAVRLYDHHDLDGIKQRIQESAQSSSVRASAETSSTSRSTQGTTDLDVLSNFFQSFQYSAALFVIPDRRHQADQLSDFSSIYQRAQHMATEPVWTQSPRGQLVAKLRRVFLVPSADAAIQCIYSMAKAIRKAKQKDLYFTPYRIQNFLPSSDGTIPQGDSASSPSPEVAIHIANMLREWAIRFRLPPDEIEVLMSMRSTIADIACCNDVSFDHLPLADKSKHFLQTFFGCGIQRRLFH